MQFTELKLHPALLQTVQREGYERPTPIQERAIPPILDGRDLLGCAQTGTGKTAAFALPILHHLAGPQQASPQQAGSPQAGAPRRSREPRVLILVPTRELASQVHQSFVTYGRGLGIRSAVVFGGVGQGSQVTALRAGVDVLVATPGRLLDLYDQKHLELRSVEILVLDEADRMLDMGFIKPIRDILAELPKRRQNLLFSATMPEAIRALAARLLHNPAEVSVTPVSSAAPLIDQQVCFIRQADKPEMLAHVLLHPEVERAIVFTRTKHGADKVARRLGKARIGATVIHGNKSQNARLRALASFKGGEVRVLVATDVLARGIDVDGVSHVINYDVPADPESYVHRIGRTGRAGAAGLALSLCDDAERSLIRDIERLTKLPMAMFKVPPDLPRAEPTVGESRATDPQAQGANRAPGSSNRLGLKSQRGFQQGSRRGSQRGSQQRPTGHARSLAP